MVSQVLGYCKNNTSILPAASIVTAVLSGSRVLRVIAGSAGGPTALAAASLGFVAHDLWRISQQINAWTESGQIANTWVIEPLHTAWHTNDSEIRGLSLFRVATLVLTAAWSLFSLMNPALGIIPLAASFVLANDIPILIENHRKQVQDQERGTLLVKPIVDFLRQNFGN